MIASSRLSAFRGAVMNSERDIDPPDSSVAQRIEQALRSRIVRGELAAEAPLRQDHIAREFRASAIPVREALRRLESTGLVVFRPRRGAIVSAVTAADAREVAEMRAALETLALDHAMCERKPGSIPTARAAIAASDASGDAETWLAENRNFHRALYALGARPRLGAAIEELWLTGDRHLMLVWTSIDYQAKSQDEHRAILAAVEAGRRAQALRALKAHILEAGRALAALIERRQRRAA
jgi:DNA-binding GntR family transcriptional regulator